MLPSWSEAETVTIEVKFSANEIEEARSEIEGGSLTSVIVRENDLVKVIPSLSLMVRIIE